MRGEHAKKSEHPCSFEGSSPHARGAHDPRDDVNLAVRIIPACAGSTADLARIMVWLEDHPRMRGEHRTP